MGHKKQPVCADVQLHFLDKKGSDRYQVQPQWSEHVSGCALCSRTLMQLMRELLGHRQGVALHVSCDACQRDLAAYVDWQQAHGNRSAAERYPYVWWHLWTCAECAEVYEWMAVLVEAEASGELEAFPFGSMLPTPIKAAFKFLTVLTCPVPRIALTLALGPSALLGAMRGSEDEMMLIDDDVEGYHLSVAVSHMQGALCTLSVATQPPVAGWAVLDLGAQHFKSALDDRGAGHVSPFPLDLLRDATGPDLVITIQSEAREPPA